MSAPVCKKVTDYEDFPGRIEATNAVEIRARATGYLMKVHFQEGTEVKQGDLLFEIDDRPYQAELLYAEGSVLQNEGRLQRLELDLRRAGDLRRRNAISQEDF
ncbi:MAG TPA: biotin/lipoyl-binding protein, partial [Gemmataceae bacterium]|nr:biotin/lipoyl-binding protein [Gemmataceae bacterium]